jgi:hypothetical protein
MTPRHPPRALRSLTTPIRPPPGEVENPSRPPRSRPGAMRVPNPRPAASHDAAASTSHDSGPWKCSAARRFAARRALPKGVFHVRGEIVPLPHLLRLCVACVTNHRIVREHRPEAPTRPRTPERPERGAGIGPNGRWPGGEAALGSAPPRAQRVAKESGALSRTRLPRLRSIADRSFGEPLWGVGVGGRTRGGRCRCGPR